MFISKPKYHLLGKINMIKLLIYQPMKTFSFSSLLFYSNSKCLSSPFHFGYTSTQYEKKQQSKRINQVSVYYKLNIFQFNIFITDI